MWIWCAYCSISDELDSVIFVVLDSACPPNSLASVQIPQTNKQTIFYSLIITDLEMSGSVTICEKGNPADVVFLLDASNSIWNPDFHEQLKFVQAVVDYFPIGDENIRVAIATFSDDVWPQFPLNQWVTETVLL